MKRAISIGVLVAFAAGCLVIAAYHFSPQSASASTYLGGSGHYQPLCQWTYKQDRVNLWDDDKTHIIDSALIGAAPTYYYHIWGDFGDDYYWVQGITYFVYWEDWDRRYIYKDQSNFHDVYFCFEDTPDRRGGQ
jgi:hypothetical protein